MEIDFIGSAAIPSRMRPRFIVIDDEFRAERGELLSAQNHWVANSGHLFDGAKKPFDSAVGPRVCWANEGMFDAIIFQEIPKLLATKDASVIGDESFGFSLLSKVASPHFRVGVHQSGEGPAARCARDARAVSSRSKFLGLFCPRRARQSRGIVSLSVFDREEKSCASKKRFQTFLSTSCDDLTIRP